MLQANDVEARYATPTLIRKRAETKVGKVSEKTVSSLKTWDEFFERESGRLAACLGLGAGV
ncbi:MAG: hypothetical protein RJB38_1058 [Pseudomonadota bacterium]|jgi:hypothetical protein